MIRLITRYFLISLALIVHASNSQAQTILQNQLQPLLEKGSAGFANLEHHELGDLISLKGLQHPDVKLMLPNNMSLSYGEIVMLAGDLFGDPKYPVSHCTLATPQDCFDKQFDALARAPEKKVTKEVDQLNIFFAKLTNELNQARQQGKKDRDFYIEKSSYIFKNLNRLTGGGSFISDYIPFGRFLSLAENNYDHFVPDSLVAYKTGHKLALETALSAHELLLANKFEEADKQLQLAYAQNAFANHYLTDSLSAGHMRTPRVAVGAIHLPSILNLLIANLMHDEDNIQGLLVFNAKGDTWKAYGDGELYAQDNQTHREMIIQIMQISADSIYETFQQGIIAEPFPEMAYLPRYKRIDELNNTAPLFKVENGELLKRESNDDPWDYHWTSHWNALLTLIKFKGPLPRFEALGHILRDDETFLSDDHVMSSF